MLKYDIWGIGFKIWIIFVVADAQTCKIGDTYDKIEGVRGQVLTY